jgi:D-alanyl-D-alanine carboxypeptidase
MKAHLQAELEAARARLGIPGVSATIIFRDGSSWTGTSGRADVAGRVDVAADTAFALASVSKTYTAALILALVHDGVIDLDASARRYIPEAVLDPRITIRQLLNHTSGLDDYFLHPPIDRALQADPDAFWSVKRTLKYVSKPYFPPGRGWHYSNTNYLYLGLIAERVTGVPLATELRKRFFGPLDLEQTWYQAVEKPTGPLAHGYRFVGAKVTAPPIDLSTKARIAPFRSVITAAGGAGSIAATSSDAARWARLLYSGETLGPEMTEQMLAGVAATANYHPRVPYGLGVQAFPIGGRLAVGHSGRLLGFRSAMRHLPDYGVTIAVLTNQSRADPGIIVADLLGVIFEPEPDCFRCQNPS